MLRTSLSTFQYDGGALYIIGQKTLASCAVAVGHHRAKANTVGGGHRMIIPLRLARACKWGILKGTCVRWRCGDDRARVRSSSSSADWLWAGCLAQPPCSRSFDGR